MKITWRSCILTSAFSIAAILIPLLLLHGKRMRGGLDRFTLFKVGTACAAIFPAVVGKQLLSRGQHRHVFQDFRVVLVVLFFPLLTKSVSGAYADILFFLIMTGGAAMLPTALFLNRSRGKTALEQ